MNNVFVNCLSYCCVSNTNLIILSIGVPYISSSFILSTSSVLYFTGISNIFSKLVFTSLALFGLSNLVGIGIPLGYSYCM